MKNNYTITKGDNENEYAITGGNINDIKFKINTISASEDKSNTLSIDYDFINSIAEDNVPEFENVLGQFIKEAIEFDNKN